MRLPWFCDCPCTNKKRERVTRGIILILDSLINHVQIWYWTNTLQPCNQLHAFLQNISTCVQQIFQFRNIVHVDVSCVIARAWTYHLRGMTHPLWPQTRWRWTSWETLAWLQISCTLMMWHTFKVKVEK